MMRIGLSVRAVVATIGLISIAALMSPPINAQVLRAGADGERFEVASIKPTPRAQVPMPQVRGDVIQISGVTLSDLIRFAYPTANGQVVVDKAPGWTTKDRFDVLAKTSGELPSSSMLRALLAERFKLRMHIEPREGTVFELTIAKKDGRLGPGLSKTHCPSQEAAPATLEEALARKMAPLAAPDVGPCQTMRIGAGFTLNGEGVTIADLARTLTYAPIFNAPVIDRTGLTDRYDFSMQYRGDSDPNAEHGPTLPSALEEQLGLKIERTRGTIDTVVIEQVEPLEAN